MSFASEIKNGLCLTASYKNCCKMALLGAIICFAGSQNGKKLKIKTENESVWLYTRALISDFTTDEGISFCAPSKPTGLYVLTIDNTNTINTLFDKLKLYTDKNNLICPDSSIYKSSCCKTAFLCGAFLGGGSISDPSKNYHAEFVTKTPLLADILFELLLSVDVGAKITVRKNSFVVYIKDCESIASLLGLMGAGMSMMELYNIKIEREVRNNVNRQVNCDNANLDKITFAAGKQIAAIQKIKDSIGFDTLPPTLVEMAELRLQNPEISLSELGSLLTPPIGKSGVNHRLKRICDIAEEIK